ncbi:TauD/TfdA family dioxygenase [Marivibrio halodurans]|uniref:TauD/TfdA family dioxygenase n=1 Tax=Marivibrio halodurans TaxID=2039722 RepID=A0A8J7S9F9_9PROT|nr:TauD/TfdA family dioxygenase [Marivibrio halodurans]MBP5857902.1 TauD/TfdA family dioxygenase [Marivibrio halodurans]
MTETTTRRTGQAPIGHDPIGQDATAPADPPDFDAYPITHRLVEAEAAGRAVRVVWEDGLICRYHVFWLRENAPDPETTHPVTREQALQLLEIPTDLEAAEAWVDAAGGLGVRWSSGERSRFHPGWLRAYSHGATDGEDGAGLHALPSRVRWDAAMMADAVPRFDGPTVLSDPAEEARWVEALHVHGLAILENLDSTPEVIETVPARLGPIRATNFGSVFDVRSKPDADSNAYTTMTLPVHTDLATREFVPGLQFLHCLANEADGGDSLLVDGFRIADDLRVADPAAFEALTTLPLTYYNKATATDYRHDAPMIRLGPDGGYEEIRWSPWLRAPVRASFEDTDRIYHGLRTIFALADDPAFTIRLRLKPGDLLGFDNRRILHGRTGFDPTTGDRWLRGCYVEREELHSRLRILARRRRAAAVENAAAA